MLAIIRTIQLFRLAMMVSKLSLHLPDPTITALGDYLKIAAKSYIPAVDDRETAIASPTA